MKKIITFCFVLMLALEIVGLLGLYFVWNNISFVRNDAYQSVFLTNNQVFFGKVTYADSQYVVLSDVYYLQVPEALQKEATDQNLVLIKRGSELHGPKDSMKINKSQIIFIEEIKDDGKVAQAIKDYKAKK
ncbi:MAG: hypothetical protein WC449_01555 [Candidatus Paceibacterota bacterium]